MFRLPTGRGGIDKLFELFDQIETVDQFSEADFAKVLGVRLKLSDESNRPFFKVYKAQVSDGPYKDLIASAEARIPDVKGTVCLVILDFRSGLELSRKRIEANYKTVEFTPASASAPKSVNDMLKVRRGRGDIVFGLSRDGTSTVRSVSFHLKTP